MKLKPVQKMKNAFGWIIRILYPVKVIGRENIVPDGPTMVVCNHLDLLDPVLIIAHYPRTVSFMAKKELFSTDFGKWFYGYLMDAVPVDREGADVAAMKTIMHKLRDGEAVGVFPEGTRCRNGELGEFHAGAALMALRTGATIQPMAYTRMVKIFRQTELVIGKPFDVSKYAGQKITREIAEEVTELLRAEINALRHSVTKK